MGAKSIWHHQMSVVKEILSHIRGEVTNLRGEIHQTMVPSSDGPSLMHDVTLFYDRDDHNYVSVAMADDVLVISYINQSDFQVPHIVKINIADPNSLGKAAKAVVEFYDRFDHPERWVAQ